MKNVIQRNVFVVYSTDISKVQMYDAVIKVLR